MPEPTANEAALRVAANALYAKKGYADYSYCEELAGIVLAALDHPDVRAALVQAVAGGLMADVASQRQAPQAADAVIAALAGADHGEVTQEESHG